jgi:hypothetical protein
MTKKKKTIIIVVSLFLLIAAGLSFFLIRANRSSENEDNGVVKQRISSKVNVIPVSERPFIQLAPTADGRHIVLNIIELKKPANSLSYEMEYQTGSMLQGFQGLLELDDLPVSDRKLFGSQSAGGAITYHEDIKGGTLLAEFMGAEDYAVKSSWRYFTNSGRANDFGSQDTKFTINNDNLASYSYLIVFNSPGYPSELDAEIISDIYTVGAEKSLKTLSSEFKVSFSTKEENAQIMGFDGKEWQEIETEVGEELATGSSPFMEAYLLIKK